MDYSNNHKAFSVFSFVSFLSTFSHESQNYKCACEILFKIFRVLFLAVKIQPSNVLILSPPPRYHAPRER